MLKLTKKGDKYWLFEDSEIGLFSPSKFTINLLNNVITIVYENGLKSKTYNVIDCEIYDLGSLVPFTTSSGDDFMAKLEELNCPCFQKNENIYIGGSGTWSDLTDFNSLTDATTPLSGTEEIPIVQSGVTKKVAVSEIGGGATLKVIAQNLTDSVAVTGTTSNTTVETYTIPANTFIVGDTIILKSRVIKTGVNGVVSQRPNIAGIEMFAQSSPATNLYHQIERQLIVKSETITEEIVLTSNASTSNGSFLSNQRINIDWSLPQTLTLNISNSHISDSSIVSFWQLLRIRKTDSLSGGGGGVSNHSELVLDDGTNPHGTTKTDVGLGNVDNTSDLNKPISTATQTALNDRLQWLVKDTTPTTAVTGTTSRTQIGSSILIPDNTFSTEDVMILDGYAVEKTAGIGTCQIQIWHNTSDTLTGATAIAVFSMANANVSAKMVRTFEISEGLLKCRINGTTNAISDIGALSFTPLSISFDPTIDNYFFTTVNLGNASDSVTRTQLLISK
ncbi:minor tail protein [Flavobacterium phage vB_FspS_hemulen6-1]|jgi:hypothetical protein|uniref:Structural protein n=3 Tax=Lillamyvirus TaxID=2843418 RepID=A0A6B9LA24_9CAUD|nr:minor tail protein [Flavobacterium phage vB_FspS_hemulen6-1]YP_009855418.1 minor tail protein [Flavobacterium phage vB_FspS_stinky9-1]QHB38897.1 structural protein [Flavobacterium phage vB_FspS_hemulen6-2]QHB38967.1 structural protein [Flavobacterium phage vB_FspS_hemulen9-1]QHB38827.1 structural protein [Flavobacterium phage vB_FspS_hemulen6-1]QHB40925.1 structural protein [Flavobacterium phage vB_FspS_stinky9-1]